MDPVEMSYAVFNMAKEGFYDIKIVVYKNPSEVVPFITWWLVWKIYWRCYFVNIIMKKSDSHNTMTFLKILDTQLDFIDVPDVAMK